MVLLKWGMSDSLWKYWSLSAIFGSGCRVSLNLMASVLRVKEQVDRVACVHEAMHEVGGSRLRLRV